MVTYKTLYNAKGKPYSPLDYQLKTIRFAIDNKRSFVLNDMGTGKTACMTWAVQELFEKSEVDTVYISCTVPTMIDAWHHHLKYISDSYKILCKGSGEFKAKIVNENKIYNIFVFNHDAPTKKKSKNKLVNNELLDSLVNNIDGKRAMLIIDESTVFKNATSNRSKGISELAKRCEYVTLLTGTPIVNSPMDAYGQICLVDLNFKATMTEEKWRNLTMEKGRCVKDDGYNKIFEWTAKPDAMETIALYMQPQIRFTAEECGSLPPLDYLEHHVSLTDVQKKLMSQLADETRAMMQSGGYVDATKRGQIKNKFIQIAAGAVKGFDERGDSCIWEVDASPKLDKLIELIEQTTNKTLILCANIGVAKLIVNNLREKYGIVGIFDGGSFKFDKGSKQGETIKVSRDDAIELFQNDKKYTLFVATAQSIFQGITLTEADKTIWYSPPSRAEVYLQSNKRVHRKGQEKPCFVHKLISCDAEQSLFDLMEDKTKFANDLLDFFEKLQNY